MSASVGLAPRWRRTAIVAIVAAAMGGALWLGVSRATAWLAVPSRPASPEAGPGEPWRLLLALADPAAGERLVAAGKGAAAPACAGCHGAREVPAAEGVPRIAGLGAGHLMAQLTAYADGTRDHPVMSPMSKALTPRDRAAAARFYAALPRPDAPPAAGVPDRAVFERGLALDRHGDGALGLRACGNCHGVLGGGQGGRLPAIAGQPVDYLAGSLRRYREITPPPDSGAALMASVARRMGDAEIDAAAAFYASLPTTGPANAAAAR